MQNQNENIGLYVSWTTSNNKWITAPAVITLDVFILHFRQKPCGDQDEHPWFEIDHKSIYSMIVYEINHVKSLLCYLRAADSLLHQLCDIC
jgi:hypothetical protein